MIVVRVELWSARDGSRTELARMRISNDGRATSADPKWGGYVGATLRGRSGAALDRGEVTRSGRVEAFPRQKLHVWHLVGRMLCAMGYGPPGARSPDDRPELLGLGGASPEVEEINGRLA